MASSELATDLEQRLSTFIARHRTLLILEREAEIERTSGLLTNCAPRLLEQKGLALGNLGVVSAAVGLGGKTCVPHSLHCWDLSTQTKIQVT